MRHEDTPEVDSSVNLDDDCEAYTKLISVGHTWKRPGI